jgi:P-type Ca2+ transporter type 2C
MFRLFFSPAIAGMSLLPVLLNWPLVEMVIDPACALAFEAEDSEADIMNRPPRPLEEPLLSLQTFVTAILQGIAMLLAVLAIYGLSLWRNYPEAEGRTLTFLTMLLCNLMLITVKLSGETSIFKMPFLKNNAYWWVMGGALSAFGVILAVPFLRSLFHFTLTKPLDMMLCLLAAFLYLLLAEILMVFTRKGSFSLSK